MTLYQHTDRFADRSGQVPKVEADSWGCVVIHPPVHTRPEERHWLTRDTPHSRADPECPRCRETRTFYAHVSPDPQRRGPARVEREARGWLATHPCISTIHVHPRRKDRAT